MMRLLPIKESTGRGVEPVISLVCGVPALGIGLGAMVLLLSYLADVPIGSKNFYQIENIPVDAPRERIGQVITSNPIKRIIPSFQLQGMILVGMCSAGLGVYLSRRRWPRRRVTTSAAGIFVCAIAFFIVWILFVRTACA
jgi:hypothetical protein